MLILSGNYTLTVMFLPSPEQEALWTVLNCPVLATFVHSTQAVFLAEEGL